MPRKYQSRLTTIVNRPNLDGDLKEIKDELRGLNEKARDRNKALYWICIFTAATTFGTCVGNLATNKKLDYLKAKIPTKVECTCPKNGSGYSVRDQVRFEQLSKDVDKMKKYLSNMKFEVPYELKRIYHLLDYRLPQPKRRHR